VDLAGSRMSEVPGTKMNDPRVAELLADKGVKSTYDQIRAVSR
jgi:hypothetical protein